MRSVLAALGLLALLPLAPARAYKVATSSSTGVELRWTALPMKFNIHQAAAPGVTATATQAAVRAAYQTWSTVVCSYFKSQDLGVVNMPWGSVEDRVNTHVWTSSWPPNYNPNALGITWTQYDPNAGKILDADTHYNPSYTWSSSGSLSAIDIQSVVTHEIGHQLGLDHSAYADATMFYATGNGDTSQRSLSSDDIAGLCYLYPSGQPPPPECTSPSHCAPNESCISNKCITASKKGYGGTCVTGAECVSAICLGYSGNSFCSQACSASSPCPNGDKCVPVSGGGPIAEACLPGSAAMGSKLLGQSCLAPADCKSNICISVPGKGYLCSQTCDLQLKDCPQSFVCVPNAMGGGLCIPDTTAPPPPPPPRKALGEPCAASNECETGLCAQVGESQVCIQLCDLDQSSSCPDGFSCLPVAGNTKGACAKGSVPAPPEKGALGAVCSQTEDCQSRLCAEAEGKRFCSQLCEVEAGCPGEAFDCVPASGSQHACMPRPSGNDLDGGGCALAPPDLSPGWLLLLLLLPLLRRRQGR